MELKPFKDTELSALGMGCMRLPGRGDFGWGTEHIDYAAAKELVDRALAAGINYYDTAWVYGDSEEFLGRAMADHPRESYHLATKFYISSDRDYRKVFEAQLKRLGTDYIDFYLIHDIGGGRAERYLKSGCIDYFEEQRKRGRIRYLGFSSHASAGELARFADAHPWDFAQIQLNYYDWLYGSAKDEYEALASRDIPIMVMEPVRGGRLANLNPRAEALLRRREPALSAASWAFRWLRSLPGVQVILSGMSSMAQLEDNLATFENAAPLAEDEARLLIAACGIQAGDIAVPCTGCRYCTPTCPAHIDIPAYMDVYNVLETRGARQAKHAIAQVSSQGGPADCVNCGACAAHCPQGIDIPGHLAALTGF